jgi:uncharacterized protein YoxC
MKNTLLGIFCYLSLAYAGVSVIVFAVKVQEAAASVGARLANIESRLDALELQRKEVSE